MKVAVLTDSGCDLDPRVREQYGIHTIRGWFQLGVTLHKDLTTQQALDGMLRGEAFAALPPDEYELPKVINQLLENHDHVLIINLSSGLDFYYGYVVEQTQHMRDLVTVVDSQSVSIGQGMQVLRAGQMLQAGHSVQEVVATLDQIRPQSLHMMVLKTLKFLHMSRYISGTQAVLGQVLNINPILTTRGGKLETLKQLMGFQPALNHMLKLSVQYGQQHPNARVSFAYVPGAEATLEHARKTVLEAGVFQDCGSHVLGTNIAAHAGPGCVGICLEPAQ